MQGYLYILKVFNLFVLIDAVSIKIDLYFYNAFLQYDKETVFYINAVTVCYSM
jgi:hypothetical protein